MIIMLFEDYKTLLKLNLISQVHNIIYFYNSKNHFSRRYENVYQISVNI